MTDVTPSPAVQFDRAEPLGASAAPACALCQQPLVERYFEVNGQPTCDVCRETIARAHAGTAGMRGVMLATWAAGGAGIVGALLYYAVVAFTGYEIGLIAIVVGWLVGSAAKWGSGGRGGAVYQALAVTITYVAIVSTYVPFIFASVGNANPTTAPTETQGPAEAGSAAAEGGTVPAAPADEPLTAGGVAIALGVLALIILASPFLAGFENAIGWLIIGFALYEAWKLTRRVVIEVTGPYAIAAPAEGVMPPTIEAPAQTPVTS